MAFPHRMSQNMTWDRTGDDGATAAQFFIESLFSGEAIRRSMGRVWFEVQNPVAGFEEEIPVNGVTWAFFVWPADGTEPPTAFWTGFSSGGDPYFDRILAFGAGPGQLARTNVFGSPVYRYPADGTAFEFDVHGQRLPPAPLVPWNLGLAWHFNRGGTSPFGATTHVLTRAQISLFVDTPP